MFYYILFVCVCTYYAASHFGDRRIWHVLASGEFEEGSIKDRAGHLCIEDSPTRVLHTYDRVDNVSIIVISNIEYCNSTIHCVDTI